MALSSDKPYPGMHLRALLASRGVEIAPDEAAALVVSVLRLAELGALDFGASCDGARESGAGAGREARRAAAGLEGATVYNVAPSEYMGSQE